MTEPQQFALVTGCSEGGIGDALCQEFHRRNVRVFATARNLAKVSHLEDLGIEVLVLDVADVASVRAAVAAVSERTGGVLDLLVNNAGGGYQAPLLDADLDEARRLFDVNVWGLLAATQAFAPLLAASAAAGRRPRVVNIGSVAARNPVPWQGIYNASKGALTCINDALRLELKPLGIGVLHIVTGGIATKFYSNASGEAIPETSLYAPIADKLASHVAGHHAKHMQGTTTEDYARQVVSNVLSPRPTTTMWTGSKSLISWLGYRFGWDAVCDYIIEYLMEMGSLRGDYVAATVAATGGKTAVHTKED